MENKRKALGRGLEQLFSDERIDFEKFEQDIYKSASEDEIVKIPIDEIRSNPYQPRKTFNEESLAELCASIKEHGVVQPIIVKKSIKGYELVAGERRTKASKLAGLTEIPAIIRDFNDNEMMEIALIENIQRENLNPIEEAECFDKILKKNNLTQDEMAHKFGKSRSYITNLLGILRLPEEVKKLVSSKEISLAHARTISKLDSADTQIEIAKKIVSEGMSVRKLESLVNDNPYERKNKVVRKAPLVNPTYAIYEETLSDKIGSKTKIKNNKIEISFDNDKDLERILEVLGISLD